MSDGAEVALARWAGRACDEWRREWRVPALHCFERVGSTNDVARRLAERGADAGTVVVADEQTRGRGQQGRAWHAPAGTALLFSVVLRPRAREEGDAAPAVLPLKVGLAVARAIECVAAVRAGVKWPNDVLLGDRKVAGVLCEASLTPPESAYIVAGIGINVSQKEADFPPDVRSRATSLELMTGASVSRARLAGRIIGRVRELAEEATGPLGADTLDALAERDVLRRRRVTVDGEWRGIAGRIAPDGALVLRRDGGEQAEIRSGRVRRVEEARGER